MENYNTFIPPAKIAIPGMGGISNQEQAKKAAQDFEAMFVAEMFRPVFESEEIDPNFGGGQGEKVFRSMLVDEYGKEVAKAGGIGIAKQVEKELLKLQEVK